MVMRNDSQLLNRRSKLRAEFAPRVVKLVVDNCQEECATGGSAERKRQLSAAIVRHAATASEVVAVGWTQCPDVLQGFDDVRDQNAVFRALHLERFGVDVEGDGLGSTFRAPRQVLTFCALYDAQRLSALRGCVPQAANLEPP
jgi:hypothetical protein